MGFFDWFTGKTSAEKVQSKLEELINTKENLERLVREIDRQLANLNPRIRKMEKEVSAYTVGNLRKVKAEKTDLEIQKMDYERDIRQIDEQIAALVKEQRRAA